MKQLTTLVISAAACLCLSTTHGQTTVKGQVTDESDVPLFGVNVIVEGSQVGTVTDIDGAYKLIVDEGATLEFSYIGFETQKVLVTPDVQTYNVILSKGSQALNEVLVTSRKRAEYAKDIPVSITAIGPKELQKSGAFEFNDYASKVPNLSFGKQGGGGDLADGRTSNSISIRGITGNATTAFYLDEIPLPETVDPKLVDIKQVEVLRGPQGTLYGSSALGGALRVLTNEPRSESFYGNAGAEISSVEEGSFNYTGDFTLNIPLVEDKLAVRTVGFYNFRSGVFDKEPLSTADQPIELLNNNHALLTERQEGVDDETTYGFHASAKWTPIQGLSIMPKVIFQETESDGYNLADGSPDNFVQSRIADIDERFEDQFTNYSLTAKYDIGKGEFVSATSYFDRFYTETEDFSEWITFTAFEIPREANQGYPVSITRDADFTKFVQEVRYVSDLDGRLNFSVGGFYADEEISEVSTSLSPGLGEFIGAESPEFDYVYLARNKVVIEEYSLFGELYYDLTDRVKATLGLRYFDATSTRERVVSPSIVSDYELLDGILPDNEASGFNPKFGLKYKFDDSKMVYASASRGFRLGGVNPILPALSFDEATELLGTTDVPDVFEDDYLWSYELGAKTGFLNNKLIVNGAVFLNDWRDLQQRTILPSTGYNFIMNIDKAQSLGLEMDISAYPIENLTLTASFGYIDSEIKDLGDQPNLTEASVGDQILLVPVFTGSGSAEYRFKVFDDKKMFVRADIQHSGERFSNYNKAPERTLDPYTIINTRVGLEIDNLDLALFANNVTNERANFGDIIALAAELEGRPRYATNRPLTVGVSVRFRFLK